MDAVSFCPYRAKAKYDWSDVKTQEFKVQQQRFEVQTTKYGELEPYPTEKDLELLGECKGSDPLQHQVICECRFNCATRVVTKICGGVNICYFRP